MGNLQNMNSIDKLNGFQCFWCKSINSNQINDGKFICKSCGNVNYRLTEKDNVKFILASTYMTSYKYEDADKIYQELSRSKNTKTRVQALFGRLLAYFGITYIQDLSGNQVITFSKYYKNHSCISEIDFYKEIIESEYKDEYINKLTELDEEYKKIRAELNKDIKYDVFICTKISIKTANNPDVKGLTLDSGIANDLYDYLTNNNLNVFYSEKNLSGIEYDAQIYTALMQSKNMLVIGTNREYLESPWVQSEWERWINFIKEEVKDKNSLYLLCPNGQNISIPEKLKKTQIFYDPLRVGSSIISSNKIEYKIEDLLDKALHCMDLVKYDEAAKIYENITNDYPQDYRGWLGLVDVLIEKNIPSNDIRYKKWINKALMLSNNAEKETIEKKYNAKVDEIRKIEQFEEIALNLKILKEEAETKAAREQKAKEEIEKEFSALSLENEKTKKRVYSLLKEKEEIEKRISKISLENEVIKERVSNLLKEKEEIKKKNENAENKLFNLLDEKDIIEKKFSKVTLEYEILEKKVVDLLKDKEEIEKKLYNINLTKSQEKEKMSNLLNEKVELEKKLEEMTFEKDKLYEQVSDLINEKNSTTKKLSETLFTNNKLERIINELTQNIKENEDKILAVITENEIAEKKIDELTLANKKLEEKILEQNVIKEKLEKKLTELTNNEIYNEKDITKKKLENEISELLKEKDKLEKEVYILINKLNNEQNEYNELELPKCLLVEDDIDLDFDKSLIDNFIKNNTLGRYPQSKVKDNLLIKELDKKFIVNNLGYVRHKNKEYKKFGKNYYLVEPIKWHILSCNNNNCKLISNLILDAKKFYSDSEENRILNNQIIYSSDYELSTIISWLNGYDGSKYDVDNYLNNGFIDIAFNSSEKNIISETIFNDINDSSFTFINNRTVNSESKHKINLLSYGEIHKYFQNKSEKQSLISEFALDLLGKNINEKYCSYWLGTSSQNDSKIHYVNENGDISDIKCDSVLGIRPVIEIKMN